MSAKVTPVKIPNARLNLGTFRVQAFNLFEEEAARAYAELRTRGNDPTSGIKIERIKEYVRKVVETKTEGESKSMTVCEDLFVLVEWWERQTIKPNKGVPDDGMDESIGYDPRDP